MLKPAYLISNSGIVTVYLIGKVHTVGREHANYQPIVDILTKTNKYEKLDDLINVAKAVQNTVGKYNASDIVIKHGELYYLDERLHNAVVDKILYFVREKFDFNPLVKFLKNLMENPSKASVDNLYRFLEANQMPVTEDGYFIGYKRVTHDYKDLRTKKNDNGIGKTVRMPRNKVQDDPSVTCSYGLHVAALKYAVEDQASLGDGKVVVVKVNPRDVVSVPIDYNNQKMRVCEYTVVSDFKEEIKQESVVSRQPVENVYGGYSSTGVSNLGNQGVVVGAGETGGNYVDGAHAASYDDSYNYEDRSLNNDYDDDDDDEEDDWDDDDYEDEEYEDDEE